MVIDKHRATAEQNHQILDSYINYEPSLLTFNTNPSSLTISTFSSAPAMGLVIPLISWPFEYQADAIAAKYVGKEKVISSLMKLATSAVVIAFYLFGMPEWGHRPEARLHRTAKSGIILARLDNVRLFFFRQESPNKILDLQGSLVPEKGCGVNRWARETRRKGREMLTTGNLSQAVSQARQRRRWEAARSSDKSDWTFHFRRNR